MKTEISSPVVRPVTVAVPPAARRPSTHTVPSGSLVDAVTTTDPAVSSVVVTPYRSVVAANAGYMATPVPDTASVCTGASAAAVGPIAGARTTTTDATSRTNSPRRMSGG
jgi:hypothetical protein